VLELYRFLLQSGFQCGGLVQGVLYRIFSDVFRDVDELRAPAKLAPPVSVMLSTKSASPLDDSLIFQYGMESRHTSVFAAFILCLTFVALMPAQQVTEIQSALRDAKLDGWLFYDFRHSDPLAYRILKPDERMFASRRWFYYIPASGEPVKIVQSIEQFKLDSLPGRKFGGDFWGQTSTL
jgi:hypothetical protein